MELKHPTTYDEQIDKLISRGCDIKSNEDAHSTLSSINYYRLSAYFLPFKKADGNYKPGTTLSNVIQIYEYSDAIELKHIGFPENWYELLKKNLN